MLDTLVPGEAHGELCPDRLRFVEQTLAKAPDTPTIVAMHHPPFASGITHMDRINLRNSAAFVEIIARNPQVELIICGHAHRVVVTKVAHAIASIGPSVAHQVELTFDPDDPGAFVLEPPAFQLHRWSPADGNVSHTVFVERFPGPFPFLSNGGDPEPGADGEAGINLSRFAGNWLVLYNHRMYTIFHVGVSMVGRRFRPAPYTMVYGAPDPRVRHGLQAA
jgi:3',5'-cyclic AMP phosphodiesterase CpdA